MQRLTSSRVACIIVYNVIMKLFHVLWRRVSLLVVCSMCLQTTRFCKLVGLACLKIYAWCFLSRHTVYGGTDCTKGNLCATIICSWSFEASSMLSKKVSNNPSEELSFFRPPNNVNTANNQCVHVVMYTTSLALLVWPLPADHSHWQVHTTLPGLMWRFCCLCSVLKQILLKLYLIMPLLPAPLLQHHP